jgi:hypothetical protein
MIWTALFRTAVISPYEEIQLTEPRGFADQTVRQVLHMAGGGERIRVRLTNRYGRTPLTIAAATAATGGRYARGSRHPTRGERLDPRRRHFRRRL